MSVVRWGLIGAGDIVRRRVAPALIEAPSCDIVAVFGVQGESAERFREAVEIVLKAWSEERFSFQGTHFSFDDVEVLPKPLQRPLPTWMAATSEGAIDWAASRGFSILMDPHSSTAELGAKRRRYTESLPKRASPMPAATSPWRACLRSRRPRRRPWRWRAVARNGWSIPMPGRSMVIEVG